MESTYEPRVTDLVRTTKGTPLVGVVEDITSRPGQCLVKQQGHPGHSLWVSVHDVELAHPRTVDS